MHRYPTNNSQLSILTATQTRIGRIAVIDSGPNPAVQRAYLDFADAGLAL